MEVKFETIDGARAKELLGDMMANRSVKKNNVKKIAFAMANGEWDSYNGELIKINESGIVVDGQHRLLAIISIDKPITLGIAYNCSAKASRTIDTGSTRSVNDVLNINGVKHYTRVPSIIQGESVIFKGKSTRHSSSNTTLKTANSVLDAYVSNKEYIDLLGNKARVYWGKSRLLSPSLFYAYYNVFSKIEKESADEFFTQFCSYNIEDVNIANLKDALVKDKTRNLRKLKTEEKEALLIKAWNYFMQGKELKLLRWQPSTEPFPSVYGIEKLEGNMF